MEFLISLSLFGTERKFVEKSKEKKEEWMLHWSSWKWLNLQWAFDDDCGACCWSSHYSVPETWRVSSIVNQTCFAEATPAPFGVWLVKKTSPKDFSQPNLLCQQTYRFLKNALKITGFFQWLYDLWHPLFHGPTLFVCLSFKAQHIIPLNKKELLA